MASLTGCIRKAGKFLNAEDRAAVLKAAQDYRADGMKAAEAGRKAIADLLASVQAELAALDKPQGFDEAAYRPEVVAWAKERFGDKKAPDGSLAWQNFTEWFGDSKVVDDAGKPLVVYHGTKAAFETPNTKGERVPGFWVTPDPKLAAAYAANGVVDARNYPPGANVMPLYASVQKPRVFDRQKESAARAFDDYTSGDYDGFIEIEDGRVYAIAVKSPEQIKSATGNTGAFDGSDQSILNQSAPESPRGQISFGKDITQQASVISLLSGADLSTWTHENAHFFLEVQSDLAIRIQQQIDAGASVSDGERGIVDDMNRLLKWFGITGAEGSGARSPGGSLEPVVDRLQLNAQLLTDFSEGKAGAPEFKGALGAKALLTMLGDVAGAVQDPEVFKAVIAGVPVDVMNMLRAQELTPESSLNNVAVLKRVFPVSSSGDVAIEPRVAGALGEYLGAVARVAAKRAPVADVGGAAQNNGAAAGASEFDGHSPIVGNYGEQGKTALDTWALMSLEEKRPFHEQFARGFEAFSFEGKAPSLELQGIFNRFRAWMTQVYRTLRGLNVKLDDDVRAVMGRMLATDRAIEEAEAARSMSPLIKTFEDAQKLGWSKEKYDAYHALAEGPTAAAVQALQVRGMKDMKWLSNARNKALKARQQEVEEQRREIRAEIRMEVYAEPVYKAWQFLTVRGEEAETARAAARRKSSKGVDPANDSILVAIAKLGGISRDSAKRDLSVSDDDLTMKSEVFGRAIFSKSGGMNADRMRETLTELGYLHDRDEFGRTDLKGLTDAISNEIGGSPEYSFAKDYSDGPRDQIAEHQVYGKLSTPDLKLRYGDGETAVWRKLSAQRMTSETGIDADVVAEQFGFDSGDALVRTLAEALPPKEAIEARTDARMLEMFGDITSPEALARAADEAIHNQVRIRMVASELKALQEATTVRGEGKNALYGARGTVDLMAKAAKEYAAQIIGRSRVKDLRPGQYAAAAARSAKLAEKAMAAGKTDEAAMHKRNQLVNLAAVQAAYEAQDGVRRAEELFKKINSGTKETVSKTRDFAAVNVARAVLAGHGIGTKGKSAQEYLDTIESNDPALHAALKDRVTALTAEAKPYKELSVDQLTALKDEIASLWLMAKRSRQVEIDGKLVDKAVATLALRERMEAIGVPDRIPGEGRAVTDSERRLTKLQSAWAALRRVESWVRLKDGTDGVGPFRRFVWQPIRDAADAYRVDKAKYLKAYRALLQGIDLGRSRIEAPELGYTFGFSKGGSGKQEILHALLHTGNESNKRKLLLGRKWAVQNEDGSIDTSRWDKFVQRMIDQGVIGKAEYDFVQGVWDLLESMKPQAQKAHRDVFGAYFSEVTADAFNTPFGDYRGGYVPAVADPEAVSDAATRALIEQETQSLSAAFPTTSKGFTKARVEYNKPLLLDLRSLSGHIDKVLLFSHLEQPVRDVRKILTDKDVSESLHRLDPTAFDGLLTPWMNRVAKQQVETPIPGSNGLMRFFSIMRSRSGLAAMFANLSNTAQQITGLSIAAVRVPPKFLLPAVAQWIHSPRATAKAVALASPYMATRMDNEVAQMTDAINDILLNPSVYEKAQAWTARHAYFMQAAVDNIIGPVVWTAAYNRALEAGESDADAVRLADAAVRETQGSTLPEDIARFESGNSFVRMFTQFASYFNMQANLMGTEFAPSMRTLGLRNGMGRGLFVFVFGFLAPALVSELIVQAFRGGPDDEDKDGEWLDDWLAALGMGTIRSGLAMVPVVGQIANTGMNMANQKPYDDRISTGPAISMIESAARGAVVPVGKLFSDEEFTRRDVRDVATLITLTTGLPATAVARPLGYAVDVARGTVNPTGPADMARGAVTGIPSPESK